MVFAGLDYHSIPDFKEHSENTQSCINDFCVVMVVQRNGKMISVHLHFLGQSTTLHMWLRQHSW